MNLLPSVVSLTLSPIRLAWRALCRFLLSRQAQVCIPVILGPIGAVDDLESHHEVMIDRAIQLTRITLPIADSPRWLVSLRVGRATIFEGISGESLSTNTIPPPIEMPVVLPGQRVALIVTNLDSVPRTFRAEIWGVPLELRAVA